MEKYKKVIGNHGEDFAEKYLKKNRYTILERNFLVRGGEIDIIAKKSGYIIFVEVKTRSTDDFGGGAAAVTYTKQQRIIKAARVYLMKFGNDVPVRFDVIIVNGHMDGDKFVTGNLEHIENAF